jgi:putative endonuclease
MTYYVYVMANRRHGAIYVGVTNDVVRLGWEHREGLVPGFTKTYGLKLLVYFEAFADINEAIHREKRLKHWKREWKVALIEKTNPEWDDLDPTVV